MSSCAPLPRQDVSFVHSADRTRIAVASMGRGPIILRAAHWLSHVSRDVESPIWQPWLARLTEANQLLRYDLRGCGLSDRTVSTINFDAWLDDLETVARPIDAPFVLIGMSQGAALSVAYAAKHPGKVSKLVIIGGYGRGLLARGGDEAARMEAETLANLMRLGWGIEGSAFAQVFTRLFVPGGTQEQICWWQDLERQSATPDVAVRTLRALHEIDVLAEAAQLDVPTLVIHGSRDARVPLDEGRILAASIPNARFVVLDSANHVPLEQEPAWEIMWQEIRAFLEDHRDHRGPAQSMPPQGLTPAEQEVLRALVGGLSNSEIAGRLGKSEKTVRNQVSVILSKLGARSRSEAIVQVLGDRSGHMP